MENYNDKVMDYFLNPRNIGVLKDPDGVGKVGNPKCGDIMQLQIKIKDNKIIDAKFQTMGCAAAIATSSMLTELIKGKSVQEALKISNEEIVKELGGLPKIKIHCSVLAKKALKKAILDYQNKNLS